MVRETCPYRMKEQCYVLRDCYWMNGDSSILPCHTDWECPVVKAYNGGYDDAIRLREFRGVVNVPMKSTKGGDD